MDKPNLIVMLTQNDRTSLQAARIFEECWETKAEYWGFKEEPLPLREMQELYSRMKACGKKTVLEVVAYSEEEGLEGAEKAAACGVDYLMGTMYYDSVNRFCKDNGIRYMPFIGKVTERPSVLNGTCEDMIREALSYMKNGICGVDLLGYRYTGDAVKLNADFVNAMKQAGLPVCIAGSVNSFERLDQIKKIKPWAFTIGSAFFENAFHGSFAEQIDRVCDYMASTEA